MNVERKAELLSEFEKAAEKFDDFKPWIYFYVGTTPCEPYITQFKIGRRETGRYEVEEVLGRLPSKWVDNGIIGHWEDVNREIKATETFAKLSKKLLAELSSASIPYPRAQPEVRILLWASGKRLGENQFYIDFTPDDDSAFTIVARKLKNLLSTQNGAAESEESIKWSKPMQVQELAVLFDRDESTIRRWMKATPPKFRYKKVGGGSIMVDVIDIPTTKR